MSASFHGRFRHRLGDFELVADLECPSLGITAIFGPSGSGKTTLLRCIAGLEHASEGTCKLNGETWQDSTREIFVPAHRRTIGYVFQHSELLPHLSVRGNLEYGWRRVPAGKRVVDPGQVIQMMGLGHLLQRRPTTLSGGERQRVAIGRALLTSPRLLLMDEPLASLDQTSRREIFPYLQRLHAESSTPILYVTHDLHEIARFADRMALMERGRIVANGGLVETLTRLDLPLAHGDQAIAVIEAEVQEHDFLQGLTMLRFSGGTLTLPRLVDSVGTNVRVGILARDVSLALSHHHDSSILNILPARVLGTNEDCPGHCLVQIDAGGTRLLARITQKSAHLLDLHPGKELYAQVKGVDIVS